MITELRIDNFAIIDRLELHFKPGLITFTGETGAGKSIIIDAVETILGGRTETNMIRSGADRANIEAVFRIPAEVRESIHSALKREDLFDEPDYLTLGREIRSEGRSVARVNGRTVNVGVLRELGEQLVDVHGQSEHLSLLRVREHIGLLDRYAGATDLLSTYRGTYRHLVAARKELHELRLAEGEAARRIDLLKYQINEIESARLEPGEEEGLRTERNRLSNAENLASLAHQALLILDEDTPDSVSVTELLGKLSAALSGLAHIDATQSGMVDNLQGILASLTEMSRDLRSYIDNIEFSPKRLDQVEERLNLIHNLKRKYGGSIEEILAFAADARGQMETITHAGERIAELQAQEGKLIVELGERGGRLSARRRQVAEKLRSDIENELSDLRMPGAQFTVDFQQRADPDGAPVEDGRKLAFDSNGLERIEFLIAPNPGEGLKPLVKIASGGETSRLMLAMKNVLVRADKVPTLIFDEIDQGIGGRAGTVVGYKLWCLARLHQVLCVTHLPQLAAFGEQHMAVSKQILDGRTLTQVVDIHGNARIEELAQMLGDTTEASLQAAREMLLTADEFTRPKHV